MTPPPVLPYCPQMASSEVRINLFQGDRLAYRFCTPDWRASRAQVPLAAVLAQVDAVDATRCQQLVLGEAPLDHPDLDAVLARCRERGLRGLTVETDGRPLARDGVLEGLRARGVTKVFVVCGGARRSVHEQTMMDEGCYLEAMEGLKRAAASPLDLYVVVPVIRWTVRDLDPLLEWARGLPGGVKGFLLALPETGQVAPPLRRVLLSYAEQAKAAARVFDECRRWKVEWGFTTRRGVLPCAAQGALDRFGGVFFDRVTYLRHAQAETFVRVAACHGCSMSQSCQGVEAAYAEAFGVQSLAPVPLEVSMDWNLKRANTLERRDFKNISDFDNDAADNGRSLIRINGHCNMSCAFCFVDRTVPDFAAADVLAQIERIAQRDPSHLVLSGGEPTLHPALPRFIARGHELGFRTIEIQTNGVKAAVPEYASALVDAGLTKVTVSLHSVDPEHSDKITRLPEGFRKTLAAMHNFRRLGVLTQVAHVITKDNFRELPQTVRFLREEFPEREGHLSICFGVAQPISDLVYNWVIPRFDEIAPFMREALDYCLETRVGFGGMIGQGGYPPCMLGGDLRYYRENLRNIYRSSDWQDQFHKSPRCSGCSFDPYCLGVRKLYVETYGDAELVPFTASLPPPPDRPAAPGADPQLVTIRRKGEASVRS